MGASIIVPSIQYNKQAIGWTILGANTPVITIPISDYNYGVLHLMAKLRMDDVGVNGATLLTLGGISGSFYGVGAKIVTDVTVTEKNEAVTSGVTIPIEGAGQTANYFTMLDLYIYNYASASAWKQVLGRSYIRNSTVVDTGNIDRYWYGHIQSNTQPTSIVLTGSAGTNHITGSSYMVDYMSKAA